MAGKEILLSAAAAIGSMPKKATAPDMSTAKAFAALGEESTSVVCGASALRYLYYAASRGEDEGRSWQGHYTKAKAAQDL